MSIEAYGLQDIKKELQHLDSGHLTLFLLRLARYKKENKELLAYLLFLADDEQGFIEQSKYEVSMMFYVLPSKPYHAIKTLRKILRYITKLSRFAASKNVEIELISGFCNNYLEYVDRKVNYRPMRSIFIKQIEKIAKLIDKLHEDEQGDYTEAYDALLEAADAKLPWFNKLEYQLG